MTLHVHGNDRNYYLVPQKKNTNLPRASIAPGGLGGAAGPAVPACAPSTPSFLSVPFGPGAPWVLCARHVSKTIADCTVKIHISNSRHPMRLNHFNCANIGSEVSVFSRDM